MMSKPGLLSPLRRVRRSEDGNTAIEFALLGPLFIGLVLSMLETGLMMTRISMLDHAALNARKLIYIGAAPTKTDVEQEICDSAWLFQNCLSNIHVEMTVLNEFAPLPSHAAECRDSADETIQPATSYEVGGGADIMFMRVCMTTDIITPGIGMGLSMTKTATGRYQVISTTAFMNEPFT